MLHDADMCCGCCFGDSTHTAWPQRQPSDSALSVDSAATFALCRLHVLLFCSLARSSSFLFLTCRLALSSLFCCVGWLVLLLLLFVGFFLRRSLRQSLSICFSCDIDGHGIGGSNVGSPESQVLAESTPREVECTTLLARRLRGKEI